MEIDNTPSQPTAKNFKELLPAVRAFAFDVDGVLSLTVSPMSTDGIPLRTANIKDGYALQLAAKLGYHIAIITGGTSESVKRRYEMLGIHDIYMARSTKLDTYIEWRNSHGLTDNQIVYMGDDMPDIPILRTVGISACPSDAAIDVKNICRYISPYSGGNGCVRDILEQVLRAQHQWGTDHSW